MNEWLLGLGIFSLIITLLCFIVVPILILIFWIAMLIDCIQRKFSSDAEKIVWAFVIIVFAGLGALIYYFVVKRKPEPVKKKRKTARKRKSSKRVKRRRVRK